jgi:hypothetical protein
MTRNIASVTLTAARLGIDLGEIVTYDERMVAAAR